MSQPSAARKRRGRARLGAAAALLAALAPCACSGSTGHPAAPPATVASPLVTPFATSLSTAQGTWASVPMGHLSQPLNTFWQLFLLPASSAHWRNEVSSLGVATNGGLLLATPDGRSLLVATRPSNLLEYSALILAEGSRPQWTPGTPMPGAAGALGAAAGEHELAIARSGSSEGVLEARSPQAGWRELTTAGALAAAPAARACAPTRLTAAGYWSSAGPLVGSACRHPGVVGLFANQQGAWRDVAPALPSFADGDQAQVLWLSPVAARITALLALQGPSGASLDAAWVDPTSGGAWTLSPPVALGTGARVLSIGQAQGEGAFVVYSLGSAEHAQVIEGPGASWRALPELPAGTATLAFPAPGRADALAVDETVMTEWTLTASARRWTRRQVVHVQILFGSSE